MRTLSDPCFSARGPRTRFKWGIMALLATMGFWTTVDFVATICLAVDLGLVTPPHGMTDISAVLSKMVIAAPVPTILLYIAHVMNVSIAHVMVPRRF
jgi:hypothetical protein